MADLGKPKRRINVVPKESPIPGKMPPIQAPTPTVQPAEREIVPA